MPTTTPLPPDKAKPGPLPWFTLVACALAVGVWFVPGNFDSLAYDRSKILGGQLWRIITGHWVHFTASHLFWNLVVLIPAGVWLEKRDRCAARATLLLSPLAISLALLAFDPTLGIYAGISGVASGVLVALAVHGLRTEPRARWLWLAVLAFFAAKVIIESLRSHPLNPELTAQAIQSVPLAHLIGAVIGAGAVLLRRHSNPIL